MDISRFFELPDEPGQSVFLWGPRKTGKSTWIRAHLEDFLLVDLLKSQLYYEYSTQPQLLGQRISALTQHPSWIVIDEIQRIPALLDEVHWLIENRGARFLLTGSSARKLRRGQANLLGGRAWRREMRPLCMGELADHSVDLVQWFVNGMLPAHFLSRRPAEHLRAYVGDYLKEEVAAEALTRNLPAFGEFLRVAALCNGELLNLENVAREVGVSARAVANYFDILVDTLLGERLPAYRQSLNRRLIRSDKFYLFDVGVCNYLARRTPQPGTSEFGKSLEHLVWMELKAFISYRQPELEMRYWRSASGFEVDFVLDDLVAIEVKSGRVHSTDLKGLTALADDGAIRKRLVVCLEPQPKLLQDGHGQVECLPLEVFVARLWSGDLLP